MHVRPPALPRVFCLVNRAKIHTSVLASVCSKTRRSQWLGAEAEDETVVVIFGLNAAAVRSPAMTHCDGSSDLLDADCFPRRE